MSLLNAYAVVDCYICSKSNISIKRTYICTSIHTLRVLLKMDFVGSILSMELDF